MFNILKKIALKITSFLKKSIKFPAQRFISWLLPRTQYDYRKQVGDGCSSSVVMAPLLWIARRFQEAPYIIKKDEEIIKDHDIIKLLNKPNKFYSGNDMRMGIAMSLNADGNAYLLKLRNRMLKVIELWYVPHFMIEPHIPQDENIFIDYYSYYPRGTEIKVSIEDIIHFRYGIDPYNTRKGLSLLKSLFREVFTDDEAANFTAALLKNSCVPSVIISPGTDNIAVSKPDKEAVKQYYKSTVGGDRRGEPLIMTAKTQIEKFGFSPADMDLAKLREIPEERVTAIFGIPAAVVGFGSGLQQTKVGATMREMRESAYEDCIIPLNQMIANTLDNQLLPDFESNPEQFRINFDLSKVRILQEDEDKKTDRIIKQVKGNIIMLSEGRAKLGYEVKPEHDVWLLPGNIFPLPYLTTPKKPEEEEKEPQEEEKRILFYPAITEELDLQSYIKTGKFNKIPTLKTKTDFIRSMIESERKQRETFYKGLLKVFDSWGRIAAQFYLDYPGIKNQIAATKAIPDMNIYEYIIQNIEFDEISYGPYYMNILRDTIDIVNATLGLGIMLSDPVELRVLNEAGTRKGLLDLEESTKTAIFRALQEGREEGEGAPQIAKRLQTIVSAGPHWTSSKIRARVIARTETKHAQNYSSLEAYRLGGINQVEIIDGQLPASDDFCIQRDGQIISIQEAYNLDDHPNNTLSFAPIL